MDWTRSTQLLWSALSKMAIPVEAVTKTRLSNLIRGPYQQPSALTQLEGLNPLESYPNLKHLSTRGPYQQPSTQPLSEGLTQNPLYSIKLEGLTKHPQFSIRAHISAQRALPTTLSSPKWSLLNMFLFSQNGTFQELQYLRGGQIMNLGA
ncbi:uncharacterized [Tachysurus ichikawai]